MLALLGAGYVSSRILLPNYAIMVALACVGGACANEDNQSPSNISDFQRECRCPPTMHIEINGTAKETSLCNNATFDWLVHTLLSQIAIEKEQVTEKAALLKQLQLQTMDNDKEFEFLEDEKEDLIIENEKLQKENMKLFNELDELRKDQGKAQIKPMDCADIQQFGFKYSGLYTVYPRGTDNGTEVFCDLKTDGGGWLLIQRRFDGSEDFARNWTDYKKGFGQISKEFWLGNDNIHHLTQQRKYELRIDLNDYDGVDGYAFYSLFKIENEKRAYRLRIGGYSGNAGNAMGQHHRFKFTTRDVDNDCSKTGQCSHLFGNGGWWYCRCYDSNLNGIYGPKHGNKGIVWFQWKDDYSQQQKVEMKIRPAGF